MSLRSSFAPLALSIAVTPAARSAPQDDVLTPHDVAGIRSVSAAAISPDGSRVAYTLGVPRKPLVDDDGAPWSELWVLDSASGAASPYVTGKVNVSAIGWTKEGSGITFLAKRGDDKNTSLYVIPLAGGEARRAVSLATDIASYSFAPDGRRIAVVASDAVPEARKKVQDKGFKQEVYEEDFQLARVWIATAFEEEAKPRPLALEGSAHALAWSPVDERIAVALTRTPLVDDEIIFQRVSVVDATSGAVLARMENPGKLGPFVWSPDGARIALVSAADLNDTNAGRLMVVPAAGGPLIDVLPDYLGHVSQIAWQNPTTCIFLAGKGAWSVFGKVDVATRTSKEIAPAQGPILTDLSLSKAGDAGAFVGSTPAHPPELFTMRHGDASPARRTTSNPWLAERRLATQEVVTFRARDGLELEGILVRPLDEAAGQRQPLILVVHGGPEAHHSNGWLTSYSNPGQFAAARGYAVFHTNYRGSTGRGVAFAKSSQGDPAGKEFDDLIDAVDHLVKMGLVDASKVGVTGGSYGGYATAWLSTRHSARFAAGVMFVGISDKVSKVGTTDIPTEEYLVHALHRPWEDWSFLLDRSPIRYAGDCKTPLLILHGKDDPRVNPGQSRELYRHLKLRGQAPVRLVLYPGEGHGNRKACARLDYSLRLMQWMDLYLVGPGGEPPPLDLDYADPRAAGEAQPTEAAVSR
jgi:dipeptidyl aminopeptidase/acylaminoacyl peptidase